MSVLRLRVVSLTYLEKGIGLFFLPWTAPKELRVREEIITIEQNGNF
jgi:hypothetical protein